MTDEERIAYLAGDAAVPLDPAEQTELDELQALLADPALWVEPDADLEQRVVAAVTTASGTASQRPADVVDLGQRRRSRQLVMGLLAAAAAVLVAVGIGVAVSGNSARPLQYAASLQPTPLAPAAQGAATLTKTANGWRIRINATGLPRRDNGEYYEAWLKNAAGVLVPIGTFNKPMNVTLWSGVSPQDFPTLTVTRQVVGGGQDSSGQVVLVGSAERTQ